jgi:4-diphosphocytidyl-2-C-methyl-D-erythritol kinase
MRLRFLRLLLAAPAVSAFVGFQPPFQSATRSYIHLQATTSSAAETSETSSTENTLSLFSPCKINLFLRIIRKREDGYHDLASLFQAIGFGDTLELTPLDEEADADDFECNMPGVPKDSSNFVIRALELMREKTGVQQFYMVNLIKQVPAQAGLGGGSANAATAMWGANELMGRPATLEQVNEIEFIVCWTW